MYVWLKVVHINVHLSVIHCYTGSVVLCLQSWDFRKMSKIMAKICLLCIPTKEFQMTVLFSHIYQISQTIIKLPSCYTQLPNVVIYTAFFQMLYSV